MVCLLGEPLLSLSLWYIDPSLDHLVDLFHSLFLSIIVKIHNVISLSIFGHTQKLELCMASKPLR